MPTDKNKTEKLQKIFADQKMIALFEQFEQLQEDKTNDPHSKAYKDGKKALEIARHCMAQLEDKAKAGDAAIAVLLKIKQLVEDED